MKSKNRFVKRWWLPFKIAAGLALLPAAGGVCGTVAAQTNAADQLQEAFVSVAKAVGHTVVSISTVHTERVQGYYLSPFEDEFTQKFFKDFFGGTPYREYKRIGLGSGFIISEDGFILTNDHVVGKAEAIHVTLSDGREFEAAVRGRDARSDLAAIKIEARGLPVAELGDSDEVRTGEWAIAVGNPFGFAMTSPEPTVTVGVVSAMNRSISSRGGQEQDFTDLIQTDAAINPGNSGGPLVNLEGKVIGISVAIFTTSGGYQGISFAIPVNRAKTILDDLIHGEKVYYGWLGVSIQDMNKEIAEYLNASNTDGVIVAQILQGGPADLAGIKPGDIIRQMNEEEIKDVRTLIRKIAQSKVGENVTVRVTRQKKELALKVQIGERPSEVSSADSAGKLPGNLTRASSAWRGMEVHGSTAGVVVTQVDSQSPAYRAGIRIGDLILEINHVPITNPGDFERVTSQIKESALLRTPRGYVVVKPD